MWLTHTLHELAWTASGSALVVLPTGSFPIDDQWALWIPSEAAHQVHPREGALVLPVWFSADDERPWSAQPTPVLRTAELDELIRTALHEGLLGCQPAMEARLALRRQIIALLRDEALAPVPHSGPAREVALAILRDPARCDDLQHWARTVHVSPKTLQRSFVAETGMPFRRWRTKVRLSAAVPILRAGEPASAAAAQVGFRSVSAFASACRTELAMTPGEIRLADPAPTCFAAMG